MTVFFETILGRPCAKTFGRKLVENSKHRNFEPHYTENWPLIPKLLLYTAFDKILTWCWELTKIKIKYYCILLSSRDYVTKWPYSFIFIEFIVFFKRRSFNSVFFLYSTKILLIVKRCSHKRKTSISIMDPLQN